MTKHVCVRESDQHTNTPVESGVYCIVLFSLLRPPDLWPLAVHQSWEVLVSQTDFLSQVMRKRSEDLLDGPISKLTLLIRDKQQLRKTYADQWNLLRQELNKVTNTHTHTNSNTYNHLSLCQTSDCNKTTHYWKWDTGLFCCCIHTRCSLHRLTTQSS